ncbi:unnamed protein product [Sphagnum balticum]
MDSVIGSNDTSPVGKSGESLEEAGNLKISENLVTTDRESEGRRSSRTPKKNTIYDESCVTDIDKLNYADAGRGDKMEIIFDEEEEFQKPSEEEFPVLQIYFLERLEQIITFLGGKPGCLKNWRSAVIKRTGGLSQGLLDVYYFNPRNKKFRSRVEVAVSLGLMPSISQIKNMSRPQHYISAMENREKFLVTQLCGAFPADSYDKVLYFEDSILFLRKNEILNEAHGDCAARIKEFISSDTEPSYALNTEKRYNTDFFSLGTVTVIDWGRILPDPSFHTATQIYPLGFKCLRQELDLALNRVIDCCCEVRAAEESVKGELVTCPLFRISVEWEVPVSRSEGAASSRAGGRGVAPEYMKVVKVYEALSPQQAWQAALLETVGLDPAASEEAVSRLRNDVNLFPDSTTDGVGAAEVTAEPSGGSASAQEV